MDLIGKALVLEKSDLFPDPDSVLSIHSSYPLNPHHPFILPSHTRTIFICIQGEEET